VLAHCSIIGESFRPLNEGEVWCTLVVNGQSHTVTSSAPQAPGIFHLKLKPPSAGSGQLIFLVKTSLTIDTFRIDSVPIYTDVNSAINGNKEEDHNADISYTKEQAWSTEFASAPVTRRVFADFIKASGQFLSAPDDETLITAPAAGIVVFSGKRIVPGTPVQKGSTIFSVTGGHMAQENIENAYKQALAQYEKAKADFTRAGMLVKDHIISEKEYQEANISYENAQTTYKTISKNYTAKGFSVHATSQGYVKSLYVSEGQFVEAGAPLATLSRNKALLLQVNVSV
jgi:biotin carboxyl carrier protein